MFGPVRGGAWGDEQWTGWWGDNPPYHYPVLVLTHHSHDRVEMKGGTTFHFVTDGIESALEQVRAVEGPGVTHLKYRILPGCSIMIDVANISVIRHFGTHRTCQDLPCGVAADSRGISWAKPRPAAGACISGAGDQAVSST